MTSHFLQRLHGFLSEVLPEYTAQDPRDQINMKTKSEFVHKNQVQTIAMMKITQKLYGK